MKKRLQTLALSLLLTAAAGPAFGLGLGQIQVKSRMNEPLVADIPVITNDPSELEQLQARLASRNPVIVTIRNSERARQITSEWQVELRDRTGIRKTYQIKEDPRPSEASGFLEMLAEG